MLRAMLPFLVAPVSDYNSTSGCDFLVQALRYTIPSATKFLQGHCVDLAWLWCK